VTASLLKAAAEWRAARQLAFQVLKQPVAAPPKRTKPMRKRQAVFKDGKQLSTQLVWQKRNKDAGLCVCCGKPRVTAYHCAAHHEVAKKRKRDLYAKRVATGRCWHCGEPVAPGNKSRCAFHAEQNNARCRERYAENKL
jgi:hypothetical protein